MMQYGVLFTILFLTISSAFANTEIANFEASEARNFDIWFVREWPTLNASHSTLEWNLTANPLNISKDVVNQEPCVRLYHWNPTTTPEMCIEELWLALDLDADSWLSFTKFTLRISWSAAYPVDVYLKIFDSSDIAPLPRPGPPRRFRNKRNPSMKYHVRRKYARIQLVNTGVLNPTHEAALKGQDPNVLPGPVPIIVTLEPLWFGVLPASVVPTLFVLVGAAVVGLFIARAVIARLQEDTAHYGKTLQPSEGKKDE